VEAKTRQNKKKTTLVKTKSDGGLGMKDFDLFDKALKLTWVKRLCSSSDAPWKYIPKSFLSNFGGTELFQCNYSYNLLELQGPLPEFYKQIIRHWQKIVSTTPHSKTEILSQTIWINKFITIDKTNGIFTSLAPSRYKENFRPF